MGNSTNRRWHRLSRWCTNGEQADSGLLTRGDRLQLNRCECRARRGRLPTGAVAGGHHRDTADSDGDVGARWAADRGEGQWGGGEVTFRACRVNKHQIPSPLTPIDWVLTFDCGNCLLQTSRSGRPWNVGNVQRISAIRAPAIDHQATFAPGQTGRSRAASGGSRAAHLATGTRRVPAHQRAFAAFQHLAQVTHYVSAHQQVEGQHYVA